MNRFSFSVCIASFAGIFACCDRAQAQCYVNVTKNCGAEQFSNACDGNCNGAAAGSDCGFWVNGNPNLNFASVKTDDLGGDSVVYVVKPRFCGVVKTCTCSQVEPGLPRLCQRIGVQYSDYSVGEAYASGDFCLEP
jgi:hypothetical protein